jgi:CubicO group peptidase (beta-lactamase class C family)
MTADGWVAPGFEPAREAFASLLSSGAETGAAVTVLRHGEPVVELRGGWHDRARERPWATDTLVNVYSVGKPLIAFAVLLLIDRGLLDVDEPVAARWPDFAAKDKESVTVRNLLTHTAGLPAFPVPRPATAYSDWDLLCADLAAAPAEHPPGTAAAEHALTYGHLLGELVRRVDGRSAGRFVADEIAGPWQLDLGFGLDAADRARCAELEYGDPGWPARQLGEPDTLRRRGLGNPAGALDLAVVNGDAWRSAEVPAVNLHATATGVARFYAGLLGHGVPLISPELIAAATSVQVDGPDLLLGRPVRWGLGVQIDDDGTWGMGGVGGSCGCADPARGYAVGYVTRRLADFDRIDAIAAALP